VFLEWPEKTRFPGFEFSRRAKLAHSGAKRRPPKNNCASEDGKLTSGCILNRLHPSKMEILDHDAGMSR
jgi:hypothetical protein